ncbi:MAG TPA: RecQ family zinc-binding domain-containing protein [Nonomuraea sp.]|nr:RecQ family zinc-binding domain-containing protein [Nonomuraea sp.]
MRRYAETTDCRRRFLLAYFGEEPPEPCDTCDTCRAGTAGRPREEQPGHDHSGSHQRTAADTISGGTSWPPSNSW